MKKLILTALALALVAITPAAFAGTSSGTLTVQASVAANCTISSTATLDFGGYDPVVVNASSPKDGTAAMTVACTKGFIPTIGIPTTGRTMSGGGDTLTYDLYKNAARDQLWGDSGADLFTPGSAPGKNGTAYTIYGRIPGGQDVGVASYSGTIQVTVNF